MVVVVLEPACGAWSKIPDWKVKRKGEGVAETFILISYIYLPPFEVLFCFSLILSRYILVIVY